VNALQPAQNMWRVGNKLIHPFNPELGVGMVRSVEGRFLRVYFPQAEREMTMAAEASGLRPLVLEPGARAVLLESGEAIEIAEASEDGYVLADGRKVDDSEIWPTDIGGDPIDRLCRLQADSPRAFRNRLDGLQLMRLREAGGLGSFLGGRIELFPHQLYTALQAVQHERVRWLLADEVGLGKTIEACLILSALVRTGRAQRALILAPSTLTVQWLGELYRKFHQVFVLLDPERIECVARDVGPDANPFEVHPFGVMSLELLASDRRLQRLLSEFELDLIVVDEAHRLPGLAHETGLSSLVRDARHALLLTAVPLQADPNSFFHLIHLLHPEIFPDQASFAAALETGEARIPCTSAVRREELGGLPPRAPEGVDLSSVHSDMRQDPRARWIADRVPGWLDAREKVLVFVHETEVLEKLKGFLEAAARTHVSVFHEGLSTSARDIEIARFRETATPILLCSEAGGEGRNFQFCDRMVHFDLPDDPIALEQRIGRLDRIGRSKPVEITYFRCEGEVPDVARLYEQLELFSRPSAGLEAALGGVKPAILAARKTRSPLDASKLRKQIETARHSVLGRSTEVFFADAYRAQEHAADVMARVPEDLESRTREFVLGAANNLGLTVVEKGGKTLYYLELAHAGKVDSLPGVPEGARYLGSFDRKEAIRRDEIDFFASGHPLVEGLLLELEDGRRGRAALLELPTEVVSDPGLLCVYKDGPDWSLRVMDAQGRLQPDWCEVILDALPKARRLDVSALRANPEARERFGAALRELADRIHSAEEANLLVAAAFFRPADPK